MFEPALKFLHSLQRFDLAMLLSVCEASVTDVVDHDAWLGDWSGKKVVVRAPAPVDDAIRALPQHDRKRIAEAVCSGEFGAEAGDDLRVESKPGGAEGPVALLAELLIHRDMMIGVATGGPRIQDVNDYYIAREARIREALPVNSPYANPHASLWDWYKHWRDNLDSYASRRAYVRNLFALAIADLTRRPAHVPPPREPTGWERVDRAMAAARAQLERAAAEEEFQAIGLLCRETIISLAQAVYDPEIHEPVDGVKPSLTDANRMLEAYVVHAFPGASNKEVRAHAKASLALALNLQHRRTATRQLAALCVEGTASTAAVISIITRAPA